MTRQQQICEAAGREYSLWQEAQAHFIDGAHWADNNPINVQHVMSDKLANLVSVAITQFVDRNTDGMCTANIECTTLCKYLQRGLFEEIEKWLYNKQWKK